MATDKRAKAISTALALTARVGLLFALAGVMWISLAEVSDDPPLIPWDKAAHFLAFFVLSGLAVTGLPRVNLVLIAAGLLGYGGLIEILQGFVGRDQSLWDVAADSVGIAACFAAMAAQWTRNGVRN